MRPNTITYPPSGIEPIGVIQFIHGMCEHRKRYADTMNFFNQKGFICAIMDLRGHGENIMTPDDLGHFDCSYRDIIEDIHDYTMYLKREHPKLPMILLGHSMGSLIARVYLKKYSKEIDALILSGTPSNNPLAGAAKAAIRIMASFKGWRYHSNTMAKLVTGPFEKPFMKEGIQNGWLSRDRQVVEAYNEDPLCGFTFSLNGYYVLMNLMQQAYDRKGWMRRNTVLPIMVISGGNDPCRTSDKAFKNAVNHLKRCGFSNTYYKLYVNMRHELFHEFDHEEVYQDILKFFEIKMGIETGE